MVNKENLILIGCIIIAAVLAWKGEYGWMVPFAILAWVIASD